MDRTMTALLPISPLLGAWVYVGLLALAGCCSGPAENRPVVVNPNPYRVELLFERDGAKLYRWYESEWSGVPRYFVVSGNTAETITEESHFDGHNTHHVEHRIPTVAAPAGTIRGAATAHPPSPEETRP